MERITVESAVEFPTRSPVPTDQLLERRFRFPRDLLAPEHSAHKAIARLAFVELLYGNPSGLSTTGAFDLNGSCFHFLSASLATLKTSEAVAVPADILGYPASTTNGAHLASFAAWRIRASRIAVLVVPPRSASFNSSFRAVSERRNVRAIFLSFIRVFYPDQLRKAIQTD
jgi:hypothetical protein